MSRVLVRLHALRGEFGAAAEREKSALLRDCRRRRWLRADDLRAYHDELLFLAAFPGSLALHRAATRALRTFGALVRALPAAQREALADSGLAGTATVHTFMFGIGRWLARAGERTEFAWPRPEDAERLDSLLRLTLTAAESDRFDSGEVGSAEWLDAASRRDRGGAVHWLLGAATSPDDAAAFTAWRAIYDAAEIPIKWTLGDSARSVSRNRVAVARPTLRRGFRALPRDVSALLTSPLPGIVRLDAAEAARWHDASLAAIAARAREVFPTIYTNPDEIYLCPLGEGAALCVLGVAPEDRSALEANYGYVMFANGIPIGYGGVTTLGAQANTGANLFESFRKSEAAFLFAQSLRAFRTLFGSSRFVVNPYQFGQDNEEALASGAYWFYDRLGFRPSSPEVRELAARERAAIARDRAHRSSRRTLVRLTAEDLLLELPGAARHALLPESILTEIGAKVSGRLSSVAAGDRDRWITTEAERLLQLCTGERRSLRPSERLGARLLVPILATIESAIARWPAAERRALWRLVRLKGSRHERGFARAAASLPRFWSAVRAATRGVR